MTIICYIQREAILKALDDNGYVVIPDILTDQECDAYIAEYKSWLDKFEEHGIPFKQRRSVIQSYRAGHFAPTWNVRIKSKQVFSAIWGTEKLLSSVDGIAISRPPGRLRSEELNTLVFVV